MKNGRLSAALLVLGAALFTAPLVWPQGRAWLFLAALALLATKFAIIGFLVNGRPIGVTVLRWPQPCKA